jgi:hypothetical protein
MLTPVTFNCKTPAAVHSRWRYFLERSNSLYPCRSRFRTETARVGVSRHKPDLKGGSGRRTDARACPLQNLTWRPGVPDRIRPPVQLSKLDYIASRAQPDARRFVPHGARDVPHEGIAVVDGGLPEMGTGLELAYVRDDLPVFGFVGHDAPARRPVSVVQFTIAHPRLGRHRNVMAPL